VYTNFDALSSVNLVTEATIGGVGHVPGSLVGSGFATGGVGSSRIEAQERRDLAHRNASTCSSAIRPQGLASGAQAT
jgi:hypothetical protein